MKRDKEINVCDEFFLSVDGKNGEKGRGSPMGWIIPGKISSRWLAGKLRFSRATGISRAPIRVMD